MRCEEIMKMNVECVSPIDRVQVAARKMRDASIGFLPVCDENDKVLGAVTDRDIAVRLVAEELAPDTPVQEIMTKGVISCLPGDELTRATGLMREHHVSRVFCCDELGRLVGVISLSDIAQIAADEGAATLRDVSEREAHT